MPNLRTKVMESTVEPDFSDIVGDSITKLLKAIMIS